MQHAIQSLNLVIQQAAFCFRLGDPVLNFAPPPPRPTTLVKSDGPAPAHNKP
jgi:hypothetical protein